MSVLFGFGNIDFGQDNTDEDVFRSHIQVEVGPRDVARRRFAFPGVDAEFSRNLGVRGRSNRWFVDMVATDAAYLLAFEAAMEAAEASETTGALTQRGTVLPRVYCERFRQVGPRIALYSPLAWMQRYEITWRILP